MSYTEVIAMLGITEHQQKELDKNGFFWKHKDDYVIREYTNIYGDVCRPTGNVQCFVTRNSVGGHSIEEIFVQTKDY